MTVQSSDDSLYLIFKRNISVKTVVYKPNSSRYYLQNVCTNPNIIRMSKHPSTLYKTQAKTSRLKLPNGSTLITRFHLMACLYNFRKGSA